MVARGQPGSLDAGFSAYRGPREIADFVGWSGARPLGTRRCEGLRGRDTLVSEELDRVSPREGAHAKARDKKARPPKVVAVNPGLRNLALHLADKRRKKKPE